MDLRATHHGYAYQDLIAGIALVDVMLGTAKTIAVDTKGFVGDRFDDLTIDYRSGRRVRLQIKHTTVDRELAKKSFSGDKRSMRIDLLFASVLSDLSHHPDTMFRIVVRDRNPDDDLAVVLKPIDPVLDPGDPLPGVTTRRFRFDPEALRTNEPWKTRLSRLTSVQIHAACEHLTIDTSAPASTLNFAEPGPAERVLLRRVVEELGAGRSPNTRVTPEHAALALTHAATGARALAGDAVTRESVAPQVGLITDFGAVAEGHPIEPAVAVHRADAGAELRTHVDAAAVAGGRVVVVGQPGVGKSWLSEQLANAYRQAGWIVARHHCWLGSRDINRDERVLTDVVIGSLLRQIEQGEPDAVTDLRPRFAASPEALAAAVQACRDADGERNVLLVVDGLDHVDRVLGRQTNRQIDPSCALVDQLSAIDLPPGVCLLIASQPGPHLANAAPTSGAPIHVSGMSWHEVASLAHKHGLFAGLDEFGSLGEDDERAVIDLVYSRCGGNALYATYLCRFATSASPLDASTPLTVNDLVNRLMRVPITATDLDTYYAHLLSGLTADQDFAIGTLALCDFAVSAEELGEILPTARPLLNAALATLAPVLNSQPGLGGLRIHHESFTRHILRGRDDHWVASVRESAATWLTARGFFTDARSFRHLPELLAHLGRYDELKQLIQPGFVAQAIRAFQPPEALVRVAGVVAQQSETRLDWPTLVACIETRKAIDTYENESLADSILEYADVVVAIVGADVVADRLMYEGRPTFPPRWGLRLCHAVDRAGVAAPWQAYIDARDAESKRETTTYSSDSDGTLQLATQLGALRLRAQRGDMSGDLPRQVAEHLELEHEARLADLVEVFASGLPAGVMPDVAAMITDPNAAGQVYLSLADLAAAGTRGLPNRTELARQAWTRAPTLDILGYLAHGIPASDVMAGLGIVDLDSDLGAATAAVVAGSTIDHANVRRWLSLLTLAHALDRSAPLRHASTLAGVGFYRAWLRYAVCTVGIVDDVAAGLMTAEAASNAVLVSLGELAAEAHPFTGKPRACDLYFIHPLIHNVIENSLVVLKPGHLDRALEHLIAIGDGTTTTTNLGTGENGPLTTNDLLKVLSRVSPHIGVEAIHSLLNVIRERRNDINTVYRITADFELATARICLAAGANQEADECWRHACVLLASYGGHKDPTISEFIDSIRDVADTDLNQARSCLNQLVDLVYLVRQHTDGRGTSHFANRWWEVAAAIDPIAAALDGADTMLAEVGFEDERVHAAHTHLLDHQVATADPIVLAALRLTVGENWRNPSTDLALLTRLETELAKTPLADVTLAIAANSIAASYDDQPMLYSDSQPQSIATPELIDAVVRLGGAGFAARTPRPDENRSSPRTGNVRVDPLELQRRVLQQQRPVIPEGRAGAIIAARLFDNQRYRLGAPPWSQDAVANAIGWRILEATLVDGARAGIDLIDDVAREISGLSNNELFAALGEGLAVRCDGASSALHTVASYCLTLAYVRIRGGGGWRTFAGRERVGLWITAFDLDPVTAERTLAAAVVNAIQSDATGTYGVTQAIVAAFAARPTGVSGGTAVDCWEAALPIIAHRLPGTAERFGHTYRCTDAPDRQGALSVALATLAVATISRPVRNSLRQALVAVMLLLGCRSEVGQAALARVLGSGLDAGRTCWLLDVVRDSLPLGELNDELALELTRLAESTRLSVRVAAGQILRIQGRPAPDPPATEPHPKVRAAFHDQMNGPT